MKEMTMILIPIVVALVSVVGSYLAAKSAARRTIKAEVHKLSSQIVQPYILELWKKRMETYPKLYGSISDFNRTLAGDWQQISQDAVNKVYDKLKLAVSECEFLLRDPTSVQCESYLGLLKKYANYSSDELLRKSLYSGKKPAKDDLIEKGRAIMASLKLDARINNLQVRTMVVTPSSLVD